MCQHKAPHRTWMPPIRLLTLYDDVTIPEPDTLFDRYKDNASPARFQEMEIDRHMNLVFDLKLDPVPHFDHTVGKSQDRSGFRNLKTIFTKAGKVTRQVMMTQMMKLFVKFLNEKKPSHPPHQRRHPRLLRL